MNISALIQTIQQCLSESDKKIELHEPMFCGKEWEYVKECIDTNWVSSVGKYVDRLESDLAAYTGAKYCVVAVNGTAALHMIYLLAGIKLNDEVLVPALTFVATCNAIRHCNAIPHFIDSEEKSLGVDVKKLDAYLSDITEIKDNVCWNRITHRPIRALCVTHVFGHPADLDACLELCERYHLVLIEDAAEALGSFYKGQHVGHHGFAGALSFNGNKIMTTGGGGAIITNDKAVAKRAKHLTTTAKRPHGWEYYHDEVGYNYRLPNINAALGCAQLENIDRFLKLKRDLAMQYQSAFENFENVKFLKEPKYAKSNYWLNAILINAISLKQRNEILTKLNKKGIGARPIWNLMNTLPMFQACPKMDLSMAEKLHQAVINLPSSAFLRKNNDEA